MTHAASDQRPTFASAALLAKIGPGRRWRPHGRLSRNRGSARSAVSTRVRQSEAPPPLRLQSTNSTPPRPAPERSLPGETASANSADLCVLAWETKRLERQARLPHQAASPEREQPGTGAGPVWGTGGRRETARLLDSPSLGGASIHSSPAVSTRQDDPADSNSGALRPVNPTFVTSVDLRDLCDSKERSPRPLSRGGDHGHSRARVGHGHWHVKEAS